MKRLILPALLALLVLAAPVQAAGGKVLVFTGGGQATRVIEQQTTDYANPVINPGVGVWSGYDYREWTASGWLTASETASTPVQSVVEDNRSRPLIVDVRAKSSGLLVVLTIEEEDETETVVVPAVRLDQQTWQYALKVRTEGYFDLATLPEIEGSNGGRGEVVHVWLTVSNPTGKTIRDIWAKFRIGRAYE